MPSMHQGRPSARAHTRRLIRAGELAAVVLLTATAAPASAAPSGPQTAAGSRTTAAGVEADVAQFRSRAGDARRVRRLGSAGRSFKQTHA